MSYWTVTWNPSGASKQARAFTTESEARQLQQKLVEAQEFTRTNTVDYYITVEEKPGAPGSECWEVSWDAHPFRREAEAFLSESAAIEFLKHLAERFVTLCDGVDRKMEMRKIC